MLEPRVDLAAIAAGRAPPRLASFQNRHIGAALRNVQRRRQPGEAAADHDDANPLVAAKRRRRDRVPRSFGVKAARQPVSLFDVVGHVVIRFARSKETDPPATSLMDLVDVILYSRIYLN
jgi:hypothetical protein